MALLAVTVAGELDLDPGPWRTVNDGVMGGISRGEILALDHGLRFHGVLSLENRGGFASARRLYDGDLAEASGVRLRVRGDGRRYQFRLRLDERYDGVSWSAMFDTDGTWQTVTLPFESFEPVFRGRPVADAGPFAAEKIRQLGFLLADGKQGDFQLDIASIDFPSDL